MKAVNLNMLAYISMARASALPELKDTELGTIESILKNAIRGNTAEDYMDGLNRPRRRNQELLPIASALSGQFSKDYEQLELNPGNYELVDEYDVTKSYQVTDQNSEVTFDVKFYFYGGIISGWSVEPEEASFNRYINELGS